MTAQSPSDPASAPVRPCRKWPFRLLLVLFLGSVLINLSLSSTLQTLMPGDKPKEKLKSGELLSPNKIVRLEIDGVIMPPSTERWLKAIDRIAEDDSVKGVLLVIDSPGGLVADSHQIYDRLKRLRDKKPAVVAMKRLAASGGYYIAMGPGPDAKIFVEPTTWTGSIGVIVPRYDVSELAKLWGVKSDPLVTGPLKNTLDPLRPLEPQETEVWKAILEDSFSRFIGVIDDGRANLDEAAIRELATGQIYTANQAVKNGLADQIGFEDEALDHLKSKLGLDSVKVVEYQFPVSLLESIGLMGSASAARSQTADPLKTLWEANVPRAMYLFGWHPGISSH